MKKENKHNNFGYTKVSNSEKNRLVGEVFTDVASKYDIMNDLMSLGVHRLWKDKLVKKIENLNSNILDAAGGTGDISFRIIEKSRKFGGSPYVILSDINNEMLNACRDRAVNQNYIGSLDIVASDAESLPFADNSFDYYTISFGIRNVSNIEKALKEAHRVLKPTGKFLCLEFSKLEPNLLQKLYDLYSFNLIPKIGKLVTKNEGAYRYLAESIELFPSQDDFKTMIYESGFRNVEYENLSFGVAAIHSGSKV